MSIYSESGEVEKRLRELHTDFLEGDITKKGYCKKKWAIIESIVPLSFQEKVEKLKKRFDDGKISADIYHDKFMSAMDEVCFIPADNAKSDKVVAGDVRGKTLRARVNSNSSPEVRSLNEASGAWTRDKKMVHTSSRAIKSSRRSPTRRSFRTSTVDSSSKKKLNSTGSNKSGISHDGEDKKAVKKPRISRESQSGSTKPKVEKSNATVKLMVPKCSICKQALRDNPYLQFYGGHPEDAVEEEEVLADPHLSLFVEEVDSIDAVCEIPQNKITGFSVFDEEGHLCPFDTGLIEKCMSLYFSGYVKPIYEDKSDIEGGIPAKELGPITGWWISGFDGGESALIGFSTALGDYILMEPSTEYAPYMAAVKEKIFMSKLVIEFLCGERGDGGDTYEDLLNTLQKIAPTENLEPLTEDRLLHNAQFICEQVKSFDKADNSDSLPLLNTPCIQTLINLTGVKFGKRQKIHQNNLYLKKKLKMMEAATPLKEGTSESYFRKQKKNENVKGLKHHHCDISESCQPSGSGLSSAFKDKMNFIPPDITKKQSYNVKVKVEKPNTATKPIMAPSKCSICKQLLQNNPDLHLYGGHPKDAVKEKVALVDPRLSLFTGEEIDDINSTDKRPQNKITSFSIFDKKGHLCPFDCGLIENNVSLYFSGFLKPIYEDNKDIEGGIPAKELGPITGWWISGFDGGESALIGFSTALGDYILMEPSTEYAPYMAVVKEKIFMSKLVIEFLCGERGDGGNTYEDLLNTLQSAVPPDGFQPLTEDRLLLHAQFVCEQVLSFDEADAFDLEPLLSTSCMQSLINMGGVTFEIRHNVNRSIVKDWHLKKKVQWTKATTTPLVKEVFEVLFRDQIDLKEDDKVKDQKCQQCGICEACQQSDCGTCTACKDMVKFGGSGCSKQPCILKSQSKVGKPNATEKMITSNKCVCVCCKQVLQDNPNLRFYGGHPKDAVEEKEVLGDAHLSLFREEEVERLQIKITGFSVFDKKRHLCPFDAGLIEKNVLLYFSGYVKPIYEDNKDIEGGIPGKELGPITEWWISGFDGGESALIGFSTALGDYILMEPSTEYAPYMAVVKEKIFISKLVIEFLCGERGDGGNTYEDLLNTLQKAVPPDGLPPFTEDRLLHYAQFVYEQVLSLDNADDSDLDSLLRTSCMQSLINLGGVTVRKRFQKREIQDIEDSEPEDEEIYQTLAEGNYDCSSTVRTLRSLSSRSKQTTMWIGDCISKCGLKTYYKEAEMEGVGRVQIGSHVLVKPKAPSTPYFVARVNNMWSNKNGCKMFHAVWYCRGSETVLGETADPTEVFSVDECEDVSLRAIAKIVKVLQYTHPEDWANLGGIKDGSEIRQQFESEGKCEDDEEILWFQKRYDKFHGKFEDLPEDLPCPKPETEYSFCESCERFSLLQNKKIPRIDEKLESTDKNNEMLYAVVHHLNEEFRCGTFVFIDPGKVTWKSTSFGKDTEQKEKKRKVDEEIYPEYYRKYPPIRVRMPKFIESNVGTPVPFIIGMITKIGEKQTLFNEDSEFSSTADIWLDVNVLYRPEDTHREKVATYQEDLNILYWTGESHRIAFKSVAGKCQVVYGENVDGIGNADNLRHWSTLGPNRFYFLQAYDPQTKTFSKPPPEARAIGNFSPVIDEETVEKEDALKTQKIKEWPPISHPLKLLDVFAGCGGLSDGLHQSGVATTIWAIEKDEAAANAFKLNNPSCTVFTDDCNDLLRLVMDGEVVNTSGQRLPQKGEVELMCGGPPCQGFSNMNRFVSSEYSSFKNSLIVSYLSYCDYYRPRFFILENVRNFVSFKRSMVLKLTLKCLVRMGYQCSFAILEAGNYGIPQTRRRVIIIAAAPGEVLPKHPSPTHVFNPRGCRFTVMVDDKKYKPDFQWRGSAPLRTITVRDAISDLPEILNGSKKKVMSYDGEPLSHFQRQLRGNQKVLKDHICKERCPIVEARIAHIPSGSDWRELPNIVVRLSDGTYTKKLIYSHLDKKNGCGANGALRGVCSCATGKKICDPMDQQSNTLIPWCLPHTANRNNQWSGIYGRIIWDDFFSTTVTYPEPMGKVGRVLHPDQPRVVSLRECARSQGFMDSYHFYGGIHNKHRQVGNAVPPPLGTAIGHEIRKCVSLKECNFSEENSK